MPDEAILREKARAVVSNCITGAGCYRAGEDPRPLEPVLACGPWPMPEPSPQRRLFPAMCAGGSSPRSLMMVGTTSNADRTPRSSGSRPGATM